MFLCGTDLRSAGRERVLPGCWQPARPAVSRACAGPDLADRPVRTAPRLPLPADHPCIKPQTEPACGLPDWKRRARGTGQDGGQGRAVHGVVPGLACGGVTGRTGPAHVNPVISHRHPDICPDETRGRAVPPARAGADPRPGKNGVAPANRTGPIKPGPLIDAATCRT